MSDTNNSVYNWPIIIKAQSVSTIQHQNQCRKGTSIPYKIHPDEVAITVFRMHGTTEQVCAAYLHDTLEDTNYQEKDLLADFGPQIHKLVMFCTEKMEKKGPVHNQASWNRRKEAVLEKAKKANSEELTVLFADKLCTTISFCRELKKEGIVFWKKFNGDQDNQYWFYSSLYTIFQNKFKDHKNCKYFLEEFNENLKNLWPEKY